MPVLWNANYSDELIFPNPSAGSVTFEFSLAHAERVNLSLFDESGRLVRRLFAGETVSAGKFQIFWDGRDGSGRDLPEGIYFWKIQGEMGSEMGGKVVLVR